ncbi:uncharacterized protein LOC125240587 [Leguminivora glycinivorella]|uniref:uncharacterized protein LOC125240587 n=1 Tax=Leguminivora glycinivorella TaxID=1035111 RepID=UPI00200DEB5B|nr:uncharacterized protein LOC125240587 [Leguminivora glycinivorella]
MSDMHASNGVCAQLYASRARARGEYSVPCVHACSGEQQRAGAAACRRHLLGLGHVAVDAASGELLGLVSWTCANAPADIRRRSGLPMPLGIVVPNRMTFYMDVDCSRIIKADTGHWSRLRKGYYYWACGDIYLGHPIPDNKIPNRKVFVL